MSIATCGGCGAGYDLQEFVAVLDCSSQRVYVCLECQKLFRVRSGVSVISLATGEYLKHLRAVAHQEDLLYVAPLNFGSQLNLL